MSQFARLIRLRHLREEIATEALRLRVSPPKPDTQAWNEIQRKIARWEQVIAVAQRELKSRGHFAQMLHDKARFTDHAHAAGQRLRSANAAIGTERAALLAVAEALSDLTLALYEGPSGGQRALEGLKHALKQLMKESGGTAGTQADDISLGLAGPRFQSQIAEVRAAVPGGAPGPVQGPMPVIDLFTLILAYFALIKTLRKR